jgi:uncharacterized membrane protein YphA (DoxX/SURF4 family)
MSIVRRLARPLLAASFVSTGVDAVLHPMPRAEAARPLVAKAAPALRLPNDPELLVRVNGAAMAGAAVLFSLGKLPRLSSLVLVATLVPTTVAERAFWREKDPAERRAQRNLLLRDAGLVGGALLAAVDTEGRPGLAWRGQHAVQTAEKAGRRASRRAEKATRRAAREAKRSAALSARSARLGASASARKVRQTVGV